MVLDVASGSGSHTITFSPVDNYEVLDALFGASPYLKVDNEDVVSGAFDAKNSTVGDAASISIGVGPPHLPSVQSVSISFK